MLFIIIIGGILVLFIYIYIYIYIYITRLALNEIFSSSNKIHWEVGRAKDLSAPRVGPHLVFKKTVPSEPYRQNTCK